MKGYKRKIGLLQLCPETLTEITPNITFYT